MHRYIPPHSLLNLSLTPLDCLSVTSHAVEDNYVLLVAYLTLIHTTSPLIRTASPLLSSHQLNKKSMILKPWEVAPLGSTVKAFVHEVDSRRKRIGLTTYAPEQWNDMLPMKVQRTPAFLTQIPSWMLYSSLFD
jgi:hypothetical protein